MRKAVALGALFFLAAAFLPAQTWFAGSVDDALAKAKASGKPLLLDFHQVGG